MRLDPFTLIGLAVGAVAALTSLPPHLHAGPRQLLGVGPTSSGGGGSNWTLVNHTLCHDDTGAGANCTTPAVDMTAGGNAKLIVIAFAYSCAGGTVFADTPTDTSSNTYTLRSRTVGNASDVQCGEIWTAISPTVTSTISFDYQSANSPQYPSMFVAGFRETATPAFGAEVHTGPPATSGTSINTGSITPAFSNALITTLVSLGTVGPTTPTSIAVDSGFTITDKKESCLSDGCYLAGGLAWIQQTTAAAVNPQWTWVTTNPALAAIATFQ